MKKIVKNLVFFFLPIIVLAYPLDYLITQGLKKSHTFAEGETLVWNDIYNGKINSDLLIYGSSRAWVHVDPKIMEEVLQRKTYNLGMDGHNFFMQNFRHEELLKYNPKPKDILFSVDAFTLEKIENLYNSDQFLPYMPYNSVIFDAASTYNGFTIFDYYLPLIRYAGNSKAIKEGLRNSIFDDKQPYIREKGYRGNDNGWNRDFEKAQQKMGHYTAKLDSTSVEKFNLFLTQCKKDGINVILVYTPEYIDGQNFIKNRKEIINLYQEISRKHAIPFLDYSNDSLSFTKKYFYNAMHLNKAGAELFTRKLAADCKPYLSK